MKNIVIAAGILLVSIFISSTISFSLTKQHYQHFETEVGASLLTENFTEATTSVNTTRTQLLSSDPGRQYARIDMNPGTSQKLYLYLTKASTTVLLNGGIPLMASGTPSFVIDGDNLYTGEVWGIASATTTVFVTSN